VKPTPARGELDQALRRLHNLRTERGAALEAGDHAAVTRLDEQEVIVLDDVVNPISAELISQRSHHGCPKKRTHTATQSVSSAGEQHSACAGPPV
jgi:hypothetical protein